MSNPRQPRILVVDDDQAALSAAQDALAKSGFDVFIADSGTRGFEVIREEKPDAILLDLAMPEMDGCQFCTQLREDAETACIPVIFVSDPEDEEDRAKALSVGAVDCLEKPLDKEILVERIRSTLEANGHQKRLSSAHFEKLPPTNLFDFSQFKRFLSDHLSLSSHMTSQLVKISHSAIYSVSYHMEISSAEIAQSIADFLRFPYVSLIDPEDVDFGILPEPFCRANLVVAVNESDGTKAFVLSNPFNLGLIDTLEKLNPRNAELKLKITQPESIHALLKTDGCDDSIRSGIESALEDDQIEASVVPDITWSENLDGISKMPDDTLVVAPSLDDIETSPVNYIANNILHAAVSKNASDIHIEPKRMETVIRFRIDGDMREMFTLKQKTAWRLVSKLKVIGGLDIAERRKPQDGSLEAIIDGERVKLRLATTSTPDGESMIVRLLYLHTKPRGLSELGMTDGQSRIMTDLANQNHGLILVVGATGSGKTTTIYSLLSQIDCRTRSLISIEDPVEYRIPYANQQQVNEKAGVTFESLLKSVVRQDPDIIFLGEIRDKYSARMAMDFASTGHLTITSLHTTNATTAIFRLERLGISRAAMADAILCVIAQKLLKKLCPHCRKESEPSAEEIGMLSPFLTRVPERVANPVGCPKCNNSGYLGREAVYEVLRFDDEISTMVRSDKKISDIRQTIRESGAYLVSDHAVEKVKTQMFSPRDVYTQVTLEETRFTSQIHSKQEDSSLSVKTEEKPASEGKQSILIVDDDDDMQSLIRTFLENDGYRVKSAKDGIDALLDLASGKYDLIISDVNMPNLDGFKLVEMMNQKGIQAPLIFLTSCGEAENEIKGLELGAIDYIKKPVQKKILLMRIKNFFGKGN